MKTDRWFFRVFQEAPNLILSFLPETPAADRSDRSSWESGDQPVDAVYRFSATELKELNHRLDGVLWPRSSEAGTQEHPVVLLEVQMHSDPGFHHRLAAQTYRFLQQHPRVLHWAVVVLIPSLQLQLGPTKPLQLFLERQVIWVSLEELSKQPLLDPLQELFTLVVRHQAELGVHSRRISAQRPDFHWAITTILWERLP